MTDFYMIHGGDAGAKRLEFLTRATWPTSELFLHEAGLKSHMKVLEVGCGGGAITRLLVEKFQLSNHVVGIDFDEKAIQIAKNSADHQSSKVEFHTFDITQPDLSVLGKNYDFIYCRFVLSHLKDPGETLKKLKAIMNPEGMIAIEDTYFDGHFSFPINSSFNRYVDLFKQSALKRGAHPNIGSNLPVLLKNSGFNNVDLRVSSPAFMKGDGKMIALMTLNAIKESSINTGVISEHEFEEIAKLLKKFTEDQDSILSLARIFQCWGKAKQI